MRVPGKPQAELESGICPAVSWVGKSKATSCPGTEVSGKSKGSSPPFSISALGSCSLGGHLSTMVWNKRLTKGETDSSTQPGSLHLLFALGGANYVACSDCGSLMCFFKCSGNVKS